MERKPNPCIMCHYARMRTDICGIYCTGGFVSEDEVEMLGRLGITIYCAPQK